MATLSEYFETEARDYLAQLDRDLDRARPDAAVLQRAARALRGSAQMAREDRVLRAASALEAAARALADDTIRWSADVATRARQTIADLRVLVERRQSAASLDAVADAAVARWRDAGVSLPASPVPRAQETRTSRSREFRTFAAREVTAIADALDRGVQQLSAAPMDREPLKMILRRQRALLGAARLQEIPVVAEILRAIDDLTRVIAKLDVGVKREWLDIYRIAREGLRATIQPLQQDEDPPPSHSLSRLRHMREELLERYGAGEVVSAAHESAGFTQATPLERAPDAMDAVDVSAHQSVRADAVSPLGVATQVQPDAELLLDDEVAIAQPTAVESETMSGRAANETLFELDEMDGAPVGREDAVLELDDVAEPAVLELDDLAEPAVLELDDLAEPAVLELDDLAEPAPLELDGIAESPSLELGDVAEPAVLELDDIAEPAALDELAREAEYEAGAGEEAGKLAVVPIESLIYQREEALRRALELRDLVALSAIDPVTHEAVDELFDLIGIALR